MDDASSLADAILAGKADLGKEELLEALIEARDLELVDPAKSGAEYHTWDKPISKYYMMTSHNTYLSGIQILVGASGEQYKKIIGMGARGVEVDIYDGLQESDEPRVTHANFSGSCPVREVFEAIKEAAFAKTEFPLFVALEIYLTEANQDKLAAMIKEIFGDMALQGGNGKFLAEGATKLPTANELRKKIVFMSGDGAKTDALVDAVNLRQWGLKEGVWKWKNYSEESFIETMGDDGKKNGLQSFQKKKMARVYPKGGRITSSNFNPVLTFTAGIHFAAINMQTGDEGFWWQQAMFRDNGGAGWIHKPVIPRWKAGKAAPLDTKMTLTVRVVAGRRMWEGDADEKYKKEQVDPFVRVAVEGMTADNKQYETMACDDAKEIAWWDETFKFTITCRRLALIKFEVLDKDLVTEDDLLGQAGARVDMLRPGWRTVQLFDQHGAPKKTSTLLVHVAIK